MLINTNKQIAKHLWKSIPVGDETAGEDFPEPFGRPLGLLMAAVAPSLAAPVAPAVLLGVTLAVAAVLDIEGRRTFPVWAAVVCFCIGMPTA